MVDFKGVCSNISSIDSERITLRLKLKMQQKATWTGSKMSVTDRIHEWYIYLHYK